MKREKSEKNKPINPNRRVLNIFRNINKVKRYPTFTPTQCTRGFSSVSKEDCFEAENFLKIKIMKEFNKKKNA